MKHVIYFLLCAALLCSILFAFLCTEISFGKPSATLYISAEARSAAIKLVLPKECEHASLRARSFLQELPPLLSEPPKLFFGAFYGLCSDAKEIYTEELHSLS